MSSPLFVPATFEQAVELLPEKTRSRLDFWDSKTPLIVATAVGVISVLAGVALLGVSLSAGITLVTLGALAPPLVYLIKKRIHQNLVGGIDDRLYSIITSNLELNEHFLVIDYRYRTYAYYYSSNYEIGTDGGSYMNEADYTPKGLEAAARRHGEKSEHRSNNPIVVFFNDLKERVENPQKGRHSLEDFS